MEILGIFRLFLLKTITFDMKRSSNFFQFPAPRCEMQNFDFFRMKILFDGDFSFFFFFFAFITKIIEPFEQLFPNSQLPGVKCNLSTSFLKLFGKIFAHPHTLITFTFCDSNSTQHACRFRKRVNMIVGAGVINVGGCAESFCAVDALRSLVYTTVTELLRSFVINCDPAIIWKP